jgi:hypothetical protein
MVYVLLSQGKLLDIFPARKTLCIVDEHETVESARPDLTRLFSGRTRA